MNITRMRLVEIIEEEVRGRIFELLEDEDSPKKGKKPATADATAEPTKPKEDPGPSGAKPQRGPDPLAAVDAEENDDASEDEEQAIDQSGTAGEEPSGGVNDEISGKTVQGISIEPKSKILPGAKEVIITFNETTDSLRLLCTGSGQVKFFYRGKLSDLP